MAIKKRSKTKREEIVLEGIKRADRAIEYEKDQRVLALEDVRFAHDEDAQWTEQAKAAREGRPVMTFDKVSGSIDQVMGDHLQNRPGIKVRAGEDGDIDVADVYTGLIRNIEAQSNAKRAYKTGFKFAISGGIGHWRVGAGYVDDESFDQELMVEEIPNPFSCYGDPMAQKVTKEDGKFWIVFEDMMKDVFEELWPNAIVSAPAQMAATAGMVTDWFSDETVRVAEYFRKVDDTFTLLRFNDGRVAKKRDVIQILDELAEGGITVESEREVEGEKIEHFLITGAEVLEEYEFIGKYFPIVPIYGRIMNIEGRIVYRGLIRKAKDAQRGYNYERSNFIEQTALQPKQPYLATNEMINDNEDQWKNMNVRNDPVLIYSLDQGQGPTRQAPGQPSSAYLAAMQISSDDIKATTGIYDASLGARSNETSGKAILERDRQGDTATYEFTDELLESLEHTGRILVDMIPRVYDGERMITILGEDDIEEDVRINQTVRDTETGEEVVLNDLTVGKYDLVVKTGASYATKRTETANQLAQVMAQNSDMSKIFADVYIKSLDLVGGEEVVERLRKIGIKEGYVEPTDEEKEENKPTPEQQQMKQAQTQLQMRDANATVGLKEAQVQTEQNKAQETFASAKLKAAQAQMEQLEIALMRGDAEGQQMILSRMRNTMALQPPMMAPPSIPMGGM